MVKRKVAQKRSRSVKLKHLSIADQEEVYGEVAEYLRDSGQIVSERYVDRTFVRRESLPKVFFGSLGMLVFGGLFIWVIGILPPPPMGLYGFELIGAIASMASTLVLFAGSVMLTMAGLFSDKDRGGR